MSANQQLDTATTADRFDVFVSYSHADAAWVREWLIPRLREHGLRVCFDYESFAAGGTIVGAITTAITQSRVTLLVITDSYLNSVWTLYEQSTVIHSHIVSGRRTIPLLLGNYTLPLAFRVFTPADFTREEDRDYQLKKLAAAIRSPTPIDLMPPEEPAPRARYRNFDFELSPSDADRYQMRAGCPQIGATTTQLITLRTAELHDDVEKIRRGAADRVVSHQVGRKLYDAIFTPEVLELWKRTLIASNISDGTRAIRLRLRLLDRRLALLPWELLHNESIFLAMARQYPVIRHSGDVHMARRIDAHCRLSILLADTAPKQRSRKQTPRDVQLIDEHLRQLQSAGRFGEIRTLASASLPSLQAALTSGSYDVVHAVCQAEHRGGKDRLLLRDRDGNPRPVDGDVFGYFIRESPIRLLVLTAREDGKPLHHDALPGVAAGANRAGVPAVVVIRGTISPRATSAFLRAFYKVLADGCPVEACVAEGRKAILTVEGLDNPQWALPLLFNDEPDALLFGDEPPDYCFGSRYRTDDATRNAPPPDPVSVATTAAAPRTNVRQELHHELIGRDAAIDQAWTALEEGGVNNVLLLRGMPGFGKTAVAAELAWQAVHRTPPRYESVIWISSSDPQVTDLGDVLRRISDLTAEGLAVAVLNAFEPGTGTDHRERLQKLDPASRLREIAALLSGGRHLLVIDDVSLAAQDAVRTFIEAMPRSVQFVVTSRHHLGLGELEIEIGPLTATDARLLAKSAGSAAQRPRTFGGNPFVIIAEARRASPLDKFGNENEPVATADYVRALFPVLPEDWRRVLAVCAALPFAAAGSIVRDGSQLDDPSFYAAVEGLLRTGLIDRRHDRLALCSTLRSLFRDGEDVAAQALADVSRSCVDALMAFLDATDRTTGSHTSERFTEIIERELGNVVWGVQTAFATGLFVYLKGFREFLHDPLYRLGFWSAALQLGDLSFLAAARVGDRNEMAWSSLYPLARVRYQSDDLREAERWCATAIGIFEGERNLRGIVAAKRYLGRIRQTERDFPAARLLFTEILDAVQQMNPTAYEVGNSIENLASLELAAHNAKDAERLLKEALAAYGPNADADSIEPALHQLGRLALADNDPDTALEYFAKALALLGRTKWRNRYARIRHAIGLAHEQRGDFDVAIEHFRMAYKIFFGLGVRSELAEADAALLRVKAMRDRVREASR
jgi:tetratricopeptide (TPR) repeat protein